MASDLIFDFSPFRGCNPNALSGQSPEELKKKFEDLGKRVDQADIKDAEKIPSDVREELGYYLDAINFGMLLAGAGEDLQLTEEESVPLIPQFSEVFPAKDFQTFLESMYTGGQLTKICEQVISQSILEAMNPLMDSLEVYNIGKYAELFRQGGADFSLLKSALNLIGLPFTVYQQPMENFKGYDFAHEHIADITPGIFAGDNIVQKKAFMEALFRDRAVEALKKFFIKDIKKNGEQGLAWKVIFGNEDGSVKRPDALKILQELSAAGEFEIDNLQQTSAIGGMEAVQILKEELLFEKIFDLHTTEDPRERTTKALTLAKEELPNLLGWGGGGTSIWGWDHLIPTHVNNSLFARDLLGGVMYPGNFSDLKSEATTLYGDSMGQGGGIASSLYWLAFEGPFYLLNKLGAHFEVRRFRRLGDEGAMHAPVKAMRAGLFLGIPSALLGARYLGRPAIVLMDRATRAVPRLEKPMVPAKMATGVITRVGRYFRPRTIIGSGLTGYGLSEFLVTEDPLGAKSIPHYLSLEAVKPPIDNSSLLP